LHAHSREAALERPVVIYFDCGGRFAQGNPNAVNGDPYGGSAGLDQSFLWRPLASSGRQATPVGRLWHIGASTTRERVSAAAPDISPRPR
jgi:phytoene dehydrogenase-like protein